MKHFSNGIFIALLVFFAASLFIFTSNHQKDFLYWGISCILALLSLCVAFSNSLQKERQMQQNNSMQDALDKILSVISDKTKRDGDFLEKLCEQSTNVHGKLEELYQKQSGEYVKILEHLKQASQEMEEAYQSILQDNQKLMEASQKTYLEKMSAQISESNLFLEHFSSSVSERLEQVLCSWKNASKDEAELLKSSSEQNKKLMADFITNHTEMIKGHTAEFNVLLDSLTQKSVETMKEETAKFKKLREEFEIAMEKINNQNSFDVEAFRILLEECKK